MGAVLYQGKGEGGVYPIYPHKASKLSLPLKLRNSVAITQKSSWLLWHNGLGHPHSQVLNVLFPHLRNKCTNFVDSCTHYLHGKMHKLSFPYSHFSPFELVHTDLWGVTPEESVNGFRYYVVFVDHFTCFTWLYLLTHKSIMLAKFVQFKAMVEN